MARLGMLRMTAVGVQPGGYEMFVEASLVSRLEAIGDGTTLHLGNGEYYRVSEHAEVLAARYDRLVAGLSAEPSSELSDVSGFASGE